SIGLEEAVEVVGRRVAAADISPAGKPRVMEYTDVLRCLTIEDPHFAANLAERDEIEPAVLDQKTAALVRLAALVAIGGALPTYSALTDAAIGMGATPDEIVEVLVVIVPTVGLPRSVSAAPRVAMALGYDVEDALFE
ncbi:MAG TPA: carboxymuconolactone decarboxylase family protein, partial [Agromyces sp.]